jgi:hypothetical protein
VATGNELLRVGKFYALGNVAFFGYAHAQYSADGHHLDMSKVGA